MAPDEKPAYLLPVDEVLRTLQSDGQRGLKANLWQERILRFGRNELSSEKSVPRWKKFLAHFKDSLVILLLLATAVSLGLWLYERETAWPFEAMTIFVVVLLNAVMGYMQESRAESAVAALRNMAAPQAKVLRDGERRTVPASELVPGDIILLEEGDRVPADARLIQVVALQTAEAALTGESLPVLKDAAPLHEETVLGNRHNMVFSGTSVTYGHGRAVVVATGMRSEMGRIAGMLQGVPAETTPLQKELNRVGKVLGIVVTIIAVVMIPTLIFVENLRGLSAIFDALLLSVALAVAAVPEGLPTIVTAILAVGVRRMAERNAIVRHLSAVETLGSANVIASDKTGTLTKNEMTVRMVITSSGRASFSGTGYAPEGEVTMVGGDAISGPFRDELMRALTVADRANNAVLKQDSAGWNVQGDPTEGALIVAARKSGLNPEHLEARFERIGEIPFSSSRKLMSTIHDDAEREERVLIFTKGAPDMLLARCTQELKGSEWLPLMDERRRRILEENEELAGQALRTLAVAFRTAPKDEFDPDTIDESFETELIFAGLIGMIDPPREEAKAAVARARSAGLRSIMITGDHSRTAGVIATELGVSDDGRAVTGTQLDEMKDAEFDKVVQEVSVFARVNPEHKLRIVKSLQKQKAIVAMTGDGVNDAPALKMANIGIAMGITGTDAAKEASDMVLADDNFATIVAAVEGGRTIFANIRKVLRYLLSCNMGEVMTMFFGVLLAHPLGLQFEANTVVLPLLATQILWINLVTDSLPAFGLGLDPADPGVMDQPPRPAHEGVITRSMWISIVLGGIVMAIGTLGVLDASMPGGFIEGSGTLSYGQTMAFTTLVLFQLFNVLNSRSDLASAFAGIFTNRWLWGGIALSIVLQIAVINVPFLQQAFSTVSLSLNDWLLCTAIASSLLWLRELRKIVLRMQPGLTKAASVS